MNGKTEDNAVSGSRQLASQIQRGRERATNAATLEEKIKQITEMEAANHTKTSKEEVPLSTPDELREQLRELTERNCAEALHEIEQILLRRGLKIYPIVHVEGTNVSSTIAIAPK